ncbi:SDR family NAD(P)-dependent oxidoreductase [Trujillonella endophytica]|uniref:SDR family NAD(P)-dependent oxidoreductase n=1 Tax=Trujillonella endophytica TaxID=673521 RepID=UPI001B8C0B61|nr:SDR family oxidoreductase [Trujillella endophytica]
MAIDDDARYQLPPGARGARLQGRVALVTGGGSDGEFLGIGAATAILFAAQGARVGVVDVSPERAARTVQRISDLGGEGLVAEADVTDTLACARAADAVAERFGRLDVLVNNAAVSGGGTVVDIDEEEWERLLRVNLGGVMRMSRAAIPHLVRAGGGSVVHVSSIAGMRGLGTAAYAAAKGGVQALTADMAYSHGPEGIRVNCIVPGHLHTPMGFHGSAQTRQVRRQSGLLDREGDAWDAAWAALFLACDESRWITGVLLPVDAGTTATTHFAVRRRLGDV